MKLAIYMLMFIILAGFAYASTTYMNSTRIAVRGDTLVVYVNGSNIDGHNVSYSCDLLVNGEVVQSDLRPNTELRKLNNSANYTNNSNWVNVSKVVDNNWDTFSSANMGTDAYLWLDYRTPFKVNSTLRVKLTNIFPNTEVIDVPLIDSCTNYFVNFTRLMFLSKRTGAPSVTFYCFDGTWYNIYDGLGEYHIWEDSFIYTKYAEYTSLNEINYFNITDLNVIAVGGNITASCYASDGFDNSSRLNYTLWIPQLNMTFKDEITQQAIIDRNVTATITSQEYHWSRNFTTAAGFYEINLSFFGEHKITYGAEGYYPRTYYFNATINSSLELYLLNDSVSSRVVHHVYDENGDDASNVTVILQREYGANYETVSIGKTNFRGEVVFYVELYDVYYKIIYKDTEGTIIEITDPSPFLTTESTDQVNLGEDFFWSWRNYDNVYYNLSLINSSGVIYFRFIYVDDNNIIREGCLDVQRVDTYDIYDVCSNCTVSPSATLTCIINPNLTGEYKAMASLDTQSTHSWQYVASLVYIKNYYPKLGQEGAWLGAIFAGTLGLLGVATITGSLLMLWLGIVGVSITGMVMGFNRGLIASIFVLIIIIIFMVRRDSK